MKPDAYISKVNGSEVTYRYQSNMYPLAILKYLHARALCWMPGMQG